MNFKWTLFLFLLLTYTHTLFAQDYTIYDYIAEYNQLAVTEMNRSGVPASITLAQGILESRYGNSRLAVQGNNHFGIKCHSSWEGKTIYADDDAPNECFRKYRNAYESYVDHSDFLANNFRYRFLFDLKPTDYKGWAKGLKKAGYATDPQYANRLIDLIEKYKLNQYDKGKGVSPIPPGIVDLLPTSYNNRVKMASYDKVVNLRHVAAEYNIDFRKLLEYNDLSADQNFAANTNIYLQPKRKKGRFRSKTHTVRQGQSMWEVAQLHGIQLECLYKRNKMREGTEPATGEVLYLRKQRPATPKTSTKLIKPRPKPPVKPTIKPRPQPPVIDDDMFEDDDLFENDDDNETIDGIIILPKSKGKTKVNEVKPPPPPTSIFYTVEAGDTLFSISRKFNTTVDAIKQANNMTGNALSPGDQLRIPR